MPARRAAAQAKDDPPPAFLVVDGHSVIHAWPELRQWNLSTGTARGRARDLLMQALRGYRDLSGEQVVVVFDGTSDQVTDEREEDGLQVFYGSRRLDADSVIERLAARYANRLRFTVVSADHMVQQTVVSFGGDFVTPAGLRERIDRLQAQLSDELARRRRR